MDNIQNCDSYINIPSSQAYRSCLGYENPRFHIISFKLNYKRTFCDFREANASIKTVDSISVS
jgi:hypothetical protein